MPIPWVQVSFEPKTCIKRKNRIISTRFNSFEYYLSSRVTEFLLSICFSSDNRENNQNISDPIDVLYEKDTRMPFNSGSIINFPRKLKDEDPYWQKDVQSSSTGHQLTNHGFLRLLQDIRQQAGSKVSCKVWVFANFAIVYENE